MKEKKTKTAKPKKAKAPKPLAGLKPRADVDFAKMPKKEAVDLSVIPYKDVDFQGDLPEDIQDCIQIAVSDMVMVVKSAAVRYWHVGRVISVCDERGKDIRPQIMDAVGCKDRLLRDCVKCYEQYPKFADLKLLAEHMDWTVMRKLFQLRDPEKREQIVSQLKEGILESENVVNVVEQMVTENQPKTKDGSVDGRTSAGKAMNPLNVMTKSGKFFSKFMGDFQKRFPDMKNAIDYCFTDAVEDEQMPPIRKAFNEEVRAKMLEISGMMMDQAEVLRKAMEDDDDTGEQTTPAAKVVANAPPHSDGL